MFCDGYVPASFDDVYIKHMNDHHRAFANIQFLFQVSLLSEDDLDHLMSVSNLITAKQTQFKTKTEKELDVIKSKILDDKSDDDEADVSIVTKEDIDVGVAKPEWAKTGSGKRSTELEENETKYSCKFCGKRFQGKQRLNSHLNSHKRTFKVKIVRKEQTQEDDKIAKINSNGNGYIEEGNPVIEFIRNLDCNFSSIEDEKNTEMNSSMEDTSPESVKISDNDIEECRKISKTLEGSLKRHLTSLWDHKDIRHSVIKVPRVSNES